MLVSRQLGSVLILVAVGISSAGAGGGYPGGGVPNCYTMPLPVHGSWYAYPLIYANPSAGPLASATSAPPSKKSVEPPLTKKLEMPPADKSTKPSTDKPGPSVIELRSTPNATGPIAKDRCRVGFWNLSGKDVMLVVAGKTQLLPRDRAVTLDLPRTFVWQANQQAGVTERVAEDQSTHEIVIR